MYQLNEETFTRRNKKMEVVCQQHGAFLKSITKLVSGEGCPKCSDESTAAKLRLDVQQFIARAELVHGNTYDYSLVDYKNARTLVSIICPTHGIFEQLPFVHLQGACPSCAEYGFKPALPASVYVLAAREKGLMKVGISNDVKSRLRRLRRVTPFAWKKIEEFEFQVGLKASVAEKEAHLAGRSAGLSNFDGATEWLIFDESIIAGLRDRSKAREGDTAATYPSSKRYVEGRKVRQESFIEKSKAIHANKYDYSLVEYKNANTKVDILCPVHGLFMQIPFNHLRGFGCARCSRARKSTEDVSREFR